MGGKKWWAFGIAVAFFLFYLGGSYSFSYTHVCARSHKKVVFDATQNNAVQHTITVCDAYSGNGKHWSPGDPARALVSEPLTGWNGTILVVIVVVIVAGAVYERWKRRRQPTSSSSPVVPQRAAGAPDGPPPPRA